MPRSSVSHKFSSNNNKTVFIFPFESNLFFFIRVLSENKKKGNDGVAELFLIEDTFRYNLKKNWKCVRRAVFRTASPLRSLLRLQRGRSVSARLVRGRLTPNRNITSFIIVNQMPNSFLFNNFFLKKQISPENREKLFWGHI